ncbi:AAA family ATPase [Methanomethylovorans sp.]|uniref:AAA family ATPase n=1 Tax=Methanomethylovorans sp. TaxID=2758717 RepID=UPI00351C943D
MIPYADNLEHLLDELSRIDQLIRIHLERVLTADPAPMDEFMGLCISEAEIQTIYKLPRFLGIFEPLPNEIKEELEAVRKDRNAKIDESLKKGTQLRLQKLIELFGLDPFETDVLLICLAPELDLKYERIYAYLQNDVTRKRPSVDLIMNLLCPTIEAKLRSRTYFSPASSLLKYDLICLTGNRQHDQLSLISSLINVDERIIGFLLGFDEPAIEVRNFSNLVKPECSFDDLILSGDLKSSLKDMINWYIQSRSSLKFLFSGVKGNGKKSTSKAACREVGTDMLVADTKALLKDGPSQFPKITKLLLREALLQNSALYLEDFDALFEDELSLTSREFGIHIKSLIQDLKAFPNGVFLSVKRPLLLNEGLKEDLMNNGFIHFSFPLPSYPLRKQLWGACLQGYDVADEVDLNVLASKFEFNGGQIKDAASTAYTFAKLKAPSSPILSMKDLYEGCRLQSNQKLNSLALKIDPHYIWEDLVLPKDIKEQLKEVCGFIRYRGKVYSDWGFEKKLSLGKGLNVLFSGPSGTGKTMAAQIVANAVDLELYKIDLSNVVSKYIGETEKNLEKIFDEAKTSNVILFFDEADALFGKRSEIKDAHDRYANIEIAYLLQKMEEHAGTVILASNFRKNIDDAFLRRLHFTIEFPLPDERSREIIWMTTFPAETPLGDDVDFGFLSKFKFTGGNIKNIALAASFLAAEGSDIVKMEHLIKATKRELQKIGKLFTEADFGEYSGWIKQSGEQDHV